ncbi:hypothetical protein PUMCH_003691 [Australozyma saopauloensis]|uniref:HMA domain-containing protein n=1 Tax=Australozyma saopauloensis TaxID=291208 RepID=A0AAX4HEY9_9ASCO|nr:hypothetical protein PUMCH_003691 [[Candida] saopauloensis]
MSHHYQFNVKMSCSGCLNAVSKALARVDGVTNTEIDMPSQTVDVTATTDYDTVYNAIVKTGKTVNDGKVIN